MTDIEKLRELLDEKEYPIAADTPLGRYAVELRNAIGPLRADLAYYQAKWEHELSTVSKLERERDALREEVSRLISATLYVPKYQWQWCLNGEWNSVVFNVVSAPNAFNRLMQKWILGIHWRKIK